MKNTKIVPFKRGIYPQIAKKLGIRREAARWRVVNGNEEAVLLYNAILSERIRAAEEANRLNTHVENMSL